MEKVTITYTTRPTHYEAHKSATDDNRFIPSREQEISTAKMFARTMPTDYKYAKPSVKPLDTKIIIDERIDGVMTYSLTTKSERPDIHDLMDTATLEVSEGLFLFGGVVSNISIEGWYGTPEAMAEWAEEIGIA